MSYNSMPFRLHARKLEACHLCGCLRPTREKKLRLKELCQEAEDGSARISAEGRHYRGLSWRPGLLKSYTIHKAAL